MAYPFPGVIVQLPRPYQDNDELRQYPLKMKRNPSEKPREGSQVLLIKFGAGD